jgi:hypothetical protein
MKWIALVIVVSLCACEPETKKVDENFIVDAMQDGKIVTVEKEDVIINGVVVGELSEPLTTGCFSIPECVRMDEVNRGIIKKLTDDFSNYAEAEAQSPPTGVTYFLTTYYGPYWATNGTYTAMRALITATGGEYPGKRVGWCNNHPERCVEE